MEVHTGDVRGGGTDANVFLTLCGRHGNSPKTHLHDCFCDRGSVAMVTLKTVNLGPLATAVVEHDNSGFASDWFLEKVWLVPIEPFCHAALLEK